MQIDIKQDAKAMGAAAAAIAATVLKTAIQKTGSANLIVATGASQFETLKALTETDGIDWSCITGFHLDEYIGIGPEHPASFRRYLRERFVEVVPLQQFHYVNADDDAAKECDRLGRLICESPIHVALIGIGENGHIAFNDPPADFETDQPYLCVELDEACRKQQAGEGWFATLNDVPRQAISMSARQILKSDTIVCSVPDQRKAQAVAATVHGPVTADVPASILQQHSDTHLILDQAAAGQLQR